MKTFEVVTKRSKRKSLLKAVLLSVTGSLIILSSGYWILNKITSDNAWEIQRFHELKNAISYPNIESINWSFIPTSSFTGVYRSDQVKDLAGISLPFEDYESYYGLRLGLYKGSQADNIYGSEDGTAQYTHGSSFKVPVFFNTKFNYSQDGSLLPTQDIQLLSQMPNQVVEVAVTFDKSYNFEEIEALIPDKLKINWYWIGTESQYDTKELPLDAQIGFSPAKNQIESYEEVQKNQEALAEEAQKELSDEEIQQKQEKIKEEVAALTAQENFSNNFSFFQVNLQTALDKGWAGYTVNNGEFDLETDIKTYLAANKDGQSAKFAGVILTGRAEDFAGLERADWIFGSNIGQTLELQPYHHLNP